MCCRMVLPYDAQEMHTLYVLAPRTSNVLYTPVHLRRRTYALQTRDTQRLCILVYGSGRESRLDTRIRH
jgi:hypothetical protein